MLGEGIGELLIHAVLDQVAGEPGRVHADIPPRC
jgi:hypothetical protein